MLAALRKESGVSHGCAVASRRDTSATYASLEFFRSVYSEMIAGSHGVATCGARGISFGALIFEGDASAGSCSERGEPLALSSVSNAKSDATQEIGNNLVTNETV